MEQLSSEARAFREFRRRKPCGAQIRIAVATFALLVGVGAAISQWETAAWHASALARTLAVEALLPLWDWTPLFGKECLIQKGDVRPQDDEAFALTKADCASCEIVTKAQRASDVDYDTLLEEHLTRSAPVIVTDALKPPQFSFSSTVRALSNAIAESPWCGVRTNLRPSVDQERLLARISRQPPGWFMQAYVCEPRAVRELRSFAPRPYFMPPHVASPRAAWVLAADAYPSPRPESLQLEPGLILMHQLASNATVKLVPKTPCQSACPSFAFDIFHGDILVVANSLWEVYYGTDGASQSVTIVTETEWSEA